MPRRPLSIASSSKQAKLVKPQSCQAETSNLHERAHQAASLLENTYASPSLGNKDNPLDELVFIIISQMTTHHSYIRVYDRLKSTADQWDKVISMPLTKLKRLISDAGLSHQKAPRIKSILRRLKTDFGTVTLDTLREMSDVDVERYLTSLPGVGIKTARCVMMYSLGRKTLPVDTHVWRVARRLKLVSKKLPYSHIHDALQNIVPPGDRYSFHVNGIAHGRTLCRPLLPHCGLCPLRQMCPTGG
jgi:endonuclease III